MCVRLLVFRVALAMLLQTGISRGDAIDGDWCSTDGMRMSIRAEKITIPSGKQIEGNYSRHAFDYAVPAGATPPIPCWPAPTAPSTAPRTPAAIVLSPTALAPRHRQFE